MAWLTTMATLPQLTANLYRQILVYPSLQHSQMECFDQARVAHHRKPHSRRLKGVATLPYQEPTSCQDTKQYLG